MAVFAIVECFNDLCEHNNDEAARNHVLNRVAPSLVYGVIILFDIATPDRIGKAPPKTFFQTENWTTLIENIHSETPLMMTRKITSFIRVHGYYERVDETHHLRLIDPKTLANSLTIRGYELDVVDSYGPTPLPAGCIGFCACKKHSERS